MLRDAVEKTYAELADLPEWTPLTPTEVRRVIRRCLFSQKDYHSLSAAQRKRKIARVRDSKKTSVPKQQQQHHQHHQQPSKDIGAAAQHSFSGGDTEPPSKRSASTTA